MRRLISLVLFAFLVAGPAGRAAAEPVTLTLGGRITAVSAASADAAVGWTWQTTTQIDTRELAYVSDAGSANFRTPYLGQMGALTLGPSAFQLVSLGLNVEQVGSPAATIAHDVYGPDLFGLGMGFNLLSIDLGLVGQFGDMTRMGVVLADLVAGTLDPARSGFHLRMVGTSSYVDLDGTVDRLAVVADRALPEAGMPWLAAVALLAAFAGRRQAARPV